MSDAEQPLPVILFVDDEATAVKYFQRAIGSLAPVATAGSVEEGKRILDQHAASIRILVSDQRMPGAYGNELLEYAKTQHPDVVRILTTAYSELEQTIEAVNQGQIYRYLQKPWEITALRMELKQALDLANLRYEHAQLLREKMTIRQSQMTANRVGSLYSLGASLSDPDTISPMEAYLSAAFVAGVTAIVPDWQTMDFSDLVSAEAFRSGKFGSAVAAALADIRSRHPADNQYNQQQLLAALVDLIGDKVSSQGGDIALVSDERFLSEFLETSPGATISAAHTYWLAYLLWLGGHGQTLQTTRTESGLQCRLAQSGVKISPARLATWIEQF